MRWVEQKAGTKIRISSVDAAQWFAVEDTEIRTIKTCCEIR
jgi:hypothetical protein